MNEQEIPETTSVEDRARFWDNHDLAGFQGQRLEVQEPVFECERKER